MPKPTLPLFLVEKENFLLSSAWLAELARLSGFKHQIFLVSALPQADLRAQSLNITWVDPTENWPIADQGFLILATHRIPQLYWDLILYQSADFSDHCASVSPNFVHFLKPRKNQDPSAINALLWNQDHWLLEAADHDPHCCLVTARAAQILKNHSWQQAMDQVLPHLGHHGLVHLRHMNLWIPDQIKGSHTTLPPGVATWAHMVEDKLNQGLKYQHTPGLSNQGVNLHIIHSWGGGLEKWCRDFCTHDQERINLVLRSVGTWGAFGEYLELFADLRDTSPLATWSLPCPIGATDIHNLGYAQAIKEIITRFAVDTIFISSFIGHALDILHTGLPTMHIVHDYYPFCPSIITHNGQTTCSSCTSQNLDACQQSGQMYTFFSHIDAQQWALLRTAYFKSMTKSQTTLIVPTKAAQKHLQQLDSRYADLKFEVIEHGNPALGQAPTTIDIAPKTRPRVLILGEIRPEKGADLLLDIIPGLVQEADIFLLGCGPGGQPWASLTGVTCIKTYSLKELGTLFTAIDADLALLPSTWPETFSYTLSELFQAQIPVLATNLGSFAERIVDQETGFLCAPHGPSILTLATELLKNPQVLDQVRTQLKIMELKTVPTMTQEYNALLPLGPLKPARIQAQLMPAAPLLHMTHVISPGLRLSDFLLASQNYLQQKTLTYQEQSKVKLLLAKILILAIKVLRKIGP